MSYSLYRCGDNTYVVVPEQLMPPIEAVRAHGDSIFVRAYPGIASTSAWNRVSKQLETRMYAVVTIEDLDN